MRRVATVAMMWLTLLSGDARAVQPEARAAAEDIVLKMGTSVRLRGSDLTLGLVRVDHDSRCPVEARCVSAGDAAVVLSVRRGRAAAADVTVHTMAAPREVSNGGWRIRVVDLMPTPSLRAPLAQREYVVTLRVDRVK